MIDGSLEINVRCRGDEAWISLAGELDIATVPRLAEAIAAAELGDAHLLVIDLTALDFLAGAGLRVIYETCRRGRAAGRDVLLVAGRASVQRVFAITDTERELPFVRKGLDGFVPFPSRPSLVLAPRRSRRPTGGWAAGSRLPARRAAGTAHRALGGTRTR